MLQNFGFYDRGSYPGKCVYGLDAEFRCNILRFFPSSVGAYVLQ
nr:MAG TPA: hypothetical protein [Caudoviricetes sp.]